MLAEGNLAEEFQLIIDRVHPSVGKLLRRCHVRVVDTEWGHPNHQFQAITIYSPGDIVAALQTRKRILIDIARHLGLTEVICLDATQLIQDPETTIQQSDPGLWLELLWITTLK